MQKRNSKLLMIGIDGATFDLIMPWIDSGYLPCIKDLMSDGVYGTLQSVVPTLSAPAWVSFMTGKNPGRHGIISFKNKPTLPFESESNATVNFDSFDEPTLWEVLGDAGKRVGVINVPVTYPPREVNGFLISCFLTPPSAQTFTFPPELKEQIPDYKICLEYNKLYFFSNKGSIDIEEQKRKLYEEQLDVSERRTSTAIKLLNSGSPDFFIIVYKGTDDIQHFFWDRPEIVLEYYKMIDGWIEDILANAGSDATVIILSDHGFGPGANRDFHVNTWLNNMGFLKLQKKLTNSLLLHLYALLYKLGRRYKTIITRYAKDAAMKMGTKITENTWSQIDWNNSKAWGDDNDGIRGIYILNEEKRKGLAESCGEYEKLRDTIIGAILDLKHPATGENVIHHAYRREEIYSGPYVDRAPDIVLVNNPGYQIRTRLVNNIFSGEYSPELPGGHSAHPNGLFIARGPEIAKGGEVVGARLIDIAPTTLHLMGVPILEDMDGRVLTEIFAEESDVRNREIKYQKLKRKSREHTTISDEDAAQIRERLKALGYV